MSDDVHDSLHRLARALAAPADTAARVVARVERRRRRRTTALTVAAVAAVFAGAGVAGAVASGADSATPAPALASGGSSSSLPALPVATPRPLPPLPVLPVEGGFVETCNGPVVERPLDEVLTGGALTPLGAVGDQVRDGWSARVLVLGHTGGAATVQVSDRRGRARFQLDLIRAFFGWTWISREPCLHLTYDPGTGTLLPELPAVPLQLPTAAPAR